MSVTVAVGANDTRARQRAWTRDTVDETRDEWRESEGSLTRGQRLKRGGGLRALDPSLRFGRLRIVFARYAVSRR